MQAASYVYERKTVTTHPNPLHQVFDVVDVVVGDIASRFHERSWSLPLKPGSAMTHDLSRLVAL